MSEERFIFPYSDKEFSTVVFRDVHFKKGTTYGPHKHERIEINYVRKGNCIMKFDDDIVKFSGSSSMIIFPEIPHYFRSTGSQGVSLVQLEFIIPGLLNLIKKKTHDNTFSFIYKLKTNAKKFISLPSNPSVRDCMERIIKEFNKKEANYQALTQIYYRELIILFSRQIDNYLSPKSEQQNKYLIKALDIIHVNMYNPEFLIEDVAKECLISPRYLRSVFYENIQMSPVEYINHAKINKAKELLLANKSNNAKEIAYTCGYSSPQYFSSVFKKITGLSPLDYREQYFRKV